MKIGILGYGSVGQKLAALFADAGYDVMVGLRSGADSSIGFATGSFKEVATQVDAVALAIPYQASLAVLQTLAADLAGKIIIDNTNPLNDDWSPLLLGQENSAGETIQNALPQSHVVKAFNTIFADVMQKSAHMHNGNLITAFVAGNDAAAKARVLKLVGDIGFAPLDTGDISSARYLEAMAHLNIRIAVPLGGGTNAAFVYHQQQS
jgi:predicted dinucleotide-binding enzyme